MICVHLHPGIAIYLRKEDEYEDKRRAGVGLIFMIKNRRYKLWI